MDARISAERALKPRHLFNVVRLDLPFDTATFDGILARQPGIALRVCSSAADERATWESMASAHVYHVSSAKEDLPLPWFVDPSLIARCPRLLAVSTYGAGHDTVDIAACTSAGICVVNQAGSNANAVAEHAFGLILSLSRRIGVCDRRLRRGDRFGRSAMQGWDLAGRTLGLVGVGHIGRRMAELASAFGMNVLATNGASDARVQAEGAPGWVPLDRLLAASDVVSLHCPLNEKTRGLFDARAFASMKPGALFINTARGGIHDESALHGALTSGHLGGAGLDVWTVEPPPSDHPLLTLDNVVATRHIGGATSDAHRRMARMGAEQIIALAQGRRPPGLVNAGVWEVFARRFEDMLDGAPIDAR
jgi:D-3-phosphoglycerate dehydrogenase